MNHYAVEQVLLPVYSANRHAATLKKAASSSQQKIRHTMISENRKGGINLFGESAVKWILAVVVLILLLVVMVGFIATAT